MFPMLYEEMKDLIPEMYFGGEEVPPYLHIKLNSTCSTEELVSIIRSIGSGGNSCGYIDDEGIHFHLPTEETIRIDLSKEFVFVSQPAIIDTEIPSAWQIFSFLMEPVKKALFIVSDRAILIEKTEHNLSVCKDLDILWAQDRFLETRVKMVESDEELEKGLAHLMKIYEEETFGSSTEMWEFWDTFHQLLMEHRLGVSVQTVH